MTARPHFPPALVDAALALHDNRLEIAEPLLRAYLKRDPFDARAIRMLAELAGRIGRNRDAETLLRRALELAPAFAAARANLAIVLYRQNRPTEALAELDRLMDVEPDHLGHANLRAAALGRIGGFDEAITLYERVLDAAPAQPKVWMSYGHVLKTVGRQADGVAAYHRALALHPALGEAWWSLANLKTVRFTDDDVRAMERQLGDDTIAVEDRFHLDFALGKAWEERGAADRAFAHYAAGNALRRTQISYDADETERFVDDGIALATDDFLAARAGWGCPAPDPIFVLGMPRAGSTLVEQILASHSQVEGTTELPDLPAMARRIGDYPHGLATLTAERAREQRAINCAGPAIIGHMWCRSYPARSACGWARNSRAGRSAVVSREHPVLTYRKGAALRVARNHRSARHRLNVALPKGRAINSGVTTRSIPRSTPTPVRRKNG